MSLLSKSSYIKGNGDQEVFGVKVSINESGVCKSGMSHMGYGKRREIVTLPPCQAMKTATSLQVTIVVTTVLDEGFDMVITGRGVVETCQENIDVSRGFMIVGVWRG
jgi:hypothetical protein